MDCSTDFVRIIPMFLPFQVPCTIHRPTPRRHSTSFSFLVLYRATCARSMWVINVLCREISDGAHAVPCGIGVRRRRGWSSAVGRSPGGFGAVVGVGPGDGTEGFPLFWGPEDADRVAVLERQVCPGV